MRLKNELRKKANSFTLINISDRNRSKEHFAQSLLKFRRCEDLSKFGDEGYKSYDAKKSKL